jgi:hypothetical protein
MLPLLVSHWIKKRDDGKFLETTETLLSDWDAKRRIPRAPAQAGPSKTKDTHPPPRTPPRPSSSSSPPATTPIRPRIVINRKGAKGKGKDHAAHQTAPAATAATAAITARPRRPKVPPSKKGKERAVELTESDEEPREPKRRKTFRELAQEDSEMDIDLPSSPKRQVQPMRKQKPLPVRKQTPGVSKQRAATATGKRHDPPCGTCERAAIECMEERRGGACVRCITRKHRCDYSRARRSRKHSEQKNDSEVDEVSC